MKHVSSVLSLGALDQHTGKLLALGLLALLVRHGRAWRRDRQALAYAPDPSALPPLSDWPAHPKVSILVAAWNEADHLPALIESIRLLRYPDCELILCAGGEDGTYELASRCESGDIRVLQQQPGEGKFRSLARCYAASQGAIIMTTDADCRLNDLSFEALIYPLATGAELAATGRYRPLPFQIAQPFVRRQWARQRYFQAVGTAPYPQFLTGANSAMCRDLLADVWDASDVNAAEDLYMANFIQLAGARIRFVPISCVETEFPATPTAYVRQQSRWRRGHLAEAQRFEQAEFRRHVRRTLAVESAMLLMPLAGLVGRLGVTVWILTWASYALAHLRFGWVLNKIENQPDGSLGRGVVQIVTADFAASALALIETALPSQRKRW